MQEGFFAESSNVEKREDESLSWTRYWYEQTRKDLDKREGLFAESQTSKKQEDEFFLWTRYWYERTRIPVLIVRE